MKTMFIAYATQDLRFVSLLKEKLSIQINLKILAAEYSLKAGDDWRDKIETTMRKADYFVPLLSSIFLTKKEPRRELLGALDLADQNKLKIFPILIEDVPNDQIPYYIKATQYIRYAEDFDISVGELIKNINENPFMDLDTFKDYISSHPLDLDEMIELAKRVFDTNWENPTDKSKAVKFVADKVRNLVGHEMPNEQTKREILNRALELYDFIIERSPRVFSLRIPRIDIYSQLDRYAEANEECEFILSQEKPNLIALEKWFWINHVWYIRKDISDSGEHQIENMVKAIQILSSMPEALFDNELSGYLRVLVEGASILKSSEYVNSAFSLVVSKKSALSKATRPERRKAILKSMKTLFILLNKSGEDDRAVSIKEFAVTLEDRWKIFTFNK